MCLRFADQTLLLTRRAFTILSLTQLTPLPILLTVERNLQDAMHATRNVLMDPRLVAGGGATEMELAVRLSEKAKSVEGVAQWPYKAVATVRVLKKGNGLVAVGKKTAEQNSACESKVEF